MENSIYNQLLPKYKKKLDKHCKKYPTTYGKVIEELKSKEYAHQCTYNAFQSLNLMGIPMVVSFFDMLKK
jgi:hypothetical protein